MRELKSRCMAGLRQLIIALVIVICNYAQATSWYVNKSGNDANDGSNPVFMGGTVGPKLTIAAGIAVASANDTIIIGDGSYAERITISATLTFNTNNVAVSKLVMDNSNGYLFLIGDTLEISDSLILTNGIIEPESPAFFLFCPNTSEVAGGNENSFIKGRLYRQTINGFGTLFFPVGVKDEYRPSIVDYNQNVPDTRVHWLEVSRGSAPVSDALPAGIRNISNRHYWELGRVGSGQLTYYIVRVYYDSADFDDGVMQPTGLNMVHSYNSGTWENLQGVADFPYTGSLKASVSTDTIGYFTLGNDSGALNPLGGFMPFAGFKFSGHCAKSKTQFQDTSYTAPPSAITQWFWDFGDPASTSDTSNIQNPDYTYNTPGNYMVKLWVLNDSNLMDSSEFSVEIHALPDMGFTQTKACIDQLILFNDTTDVLAPDTINNRFWDLGDGTTTNQKSFSHIFNDTGNYNVLLIATSSAGCVDSIQKTIHVNPLPVAGFTNTSVCFGVGTDFVDTSKMIAPGSIVDRYWDLGDGNSINGKSTNHTYGAAGDYVVTLVVTSDQGCTDTTDKSIKVRPLPKVFIENGPVCFGQLSRFRDTSSVELPETIASNLWKLGDGTTSSGKSISYAYGVAGTYNIKLIVTTSTGCVDSMSRTTTVYKKPSPDFTSSFACDGELSSFVRFPSTDIPENELTYSWFDNYILKKTDTAFSSVLPGAGDHKITLIATSNKGCKDSMVLTQTIYSRPTVRFYLDQTFANNDSIQCLKNNKFTFVRKASAGQSQSTTATWKWGDGTTGTLLDSSHSYSSENTYSVKLIGLTDMGCLDSFERKYVVKGSIAPNIGKLGVCTPDSITFLDSGTVSTSAITGRQWIFPGGVLASGSQTKQWIKQTGPIDVKLISTNAEGCTDSITKSYSFTAYPVISFLVTGSLPFCPGDSIAVKADGGLKMLWKFDNDTNRTKVFKSAGYYTVRASNSPACFVEDSFFVILYSPANIRTGKDTVIFTGSKATLRAAGGVTYSWTPTATLNPTTGAVVFASPVDSGEYIVTGVSADGCIGSDTIKIHVVDRDFIRIPNLITPNGDGENDYWQLNDLRYLANFDLTITNYAGKIVYQTSNYKNDWNAVLDGANLPEGIYYYQLKNRTNEEIYKGYIQVIR